MIEITYQGNNEVLDLINTPNLVLSAYDGLDNSPTAEIVTTTNPNFRGSQYQRSAIQDRAISFTFYVYNVEATRQRILQTFKSGEQGILELKSDYREGSITCYVEEVVWDKFQQITICQIFLRCPDPYFEGLGEIITELDNILDKFHFEVDIPEEGIQLGIIQNEHITTIVNPSDIEIGFIIEIYANGNVINPIIKNLTTDKFIGVNDTLVDGDILRINTNKGNKGITLYRGTQEINLINKMTRFSTFFNLIRNGNIISYEGDGAENSNAFIRYNEKYEAI